MSIKDMYVIKVEKEKMSSIAKKMIETLHYSKTARSQKPIKTFRLLNITNEVKGIAVIGQPCGRNANQFYGGNVVELRRFVLSPCRLKNSGSFFLSKVIKYLKKNTEFDTLISYADPNYGHDGGLYRAANFSFMGEQMSTNPRKVLYKGKKYTLREMYQKNKHKVYTKKALELQNAIKAGKADYCDFEKKLIYAYDLKKGDVR